jgi:hypothetical protein
VAYLMEPTAPTDTPDDERPVMDEAITPREAYSLQRESFLESLKDALAREDVDAVRVFTRAVEALDRTEAARLNAATRLNAPEYVVCADCGRGVPAFIEDASTAVHGITVWADCPACMVTGICADSDRCDACGERVDPVDGCDCVSCAACGDRLPCYESEAFPENGDASVLEPWCGDCMDMAVSHLCEPVSRAPFPCYGCDNVDADRWGDVGGGADVPACGRCVAAATVGLNPDDMDPDFTDLDSLTLTQLHALADVCDVDADDPVRRVLSALGEIVGHDGEPLRECLAHLRADILAALRSAVF